MVEVVRIEIGKKNLKRALDFLSALRSEALFEAGNGKLRSKVVDAANVAMGEVEVIANVEGSGKFGLDVDNVAKRITKLDDEILVEISSGKAQFKSGRKRYSAPVIPEEYFKPLKDINIDFETKIVVLGAEFSDIVTSAKGISDYVLFDGNKIVVGSNATEQMVLELEDENVGNSRAAYSSNYLELVAKTVNKNDTVEIEYSTDKPCRITVIGDDILMKAIIATRIIEE